MKLFNRKASATAELDPAWGDEQARRFREQLAKGKWEEANSFLQAVTNWDDLQFYANVLTEVGGRPKWAEEWVKARPDSAVGWLMRGAQGVKWAWDARGSGNAESVEDKAWGIFYQRLKEAEADLHRAAELDPANPVPWTFLLIIGRGLDAGIGEIGERLKQVQARKPWHHPALSQALQGYAKKWGGSHELMFDLARQVAAGAAEGSSAHTLLAEAHIERWIYMANWDHEEAAAREYFTSEAVADEVRQAADRSIFSASYERPKLAPLDCNIFTYCFFRAKDWDRARRSMEAMSGTLTKIPWTYAGEPAQIFKVVSERILKGQ